MRWANVSIHMSVRMPANLRCPNKFSFLAKRDLIHFVNWLCNCLTTMLVICMSYSSMFVSKQKDALPFLRAALMHYGWSESSLPLVGWKRSSAGNWEQLRVEMSLNAHIRGPALVNALMCVLWFVPQENPAQLPWPELATSNRDFHLQPPVAGNVRPQRWLPTAQDR